MFLFLAFIPIFLRSDKSDEFQKLQGYELCICIL